MVTLRAFIVASEAAPVSIEIRTLRPRITCCCCCLRMPCPKSSISGASSSCCLRSRDSGCIVTLGRGRKPSPMACRIGERRPCTVRRCITVLSLLLMVMLLMIVLLIPLPTGLVAWAWLLLIGLLLLARPSLKCVALGMVSLAVTPRWVLPLLLALLPLLLALQPLLLALLLVLLPLLPLLPLLLVLLRRLPRLLVMLGRLLPVGPHR